MQARMHKTIHAALAALLMAAVALPPAAAAPRDGGGGARASGGGGGGGARAGGGGANRQTAQVNNTKADARSNNVRSTSSNSVNSNRNTNVNASRNTNVNVNVDNNNNCCNNGWDNDYHPVATAVAVSATVAVIGSMVRTVPANCVPINYGGMVYQQCGSTWYQPQGSQFVVVNPPY